ncbi:MAG: hypothetical protein ABSF90_11480 [Syntrophobacteraceae bacterium]|jgi:putative effector of murein hydrolase LrgA (UPF0299 family)
MLGRKTHGFNYCEVFVAGGIGFLMPEIGAFIKEAAGGLDYVFYISGTVLVMAVAAWLSQSLSRQAKSRPPRP